MEKHSFKKSIILHLLPGILMGALYFLIRLPIQKLGFPSIFALTLAGMVTIVPFELGYLLYQGKKAAGKVTLEGVISYRKPILWWEYIVWVIVVFLAIGLIFTIFKPVEEFLQEQLFFWVPRLDNGLSGDYSQRNLTITYVLFLIVIVVVGPWVEELYFRGYLLPRIPGKMPLLFHSFLFALYHVFTPWMILTRTVGLLPLIYAVRKKNINIGIISHILLNSLDFFIAVSFMLSMS